MKLTFALRTRAVRIRWLLEELGVPYELVKLDPAREVPTLVDGDLTLFESSAICLYLADRFPDAHLAPPPGSADRGRYYQWIVFAEGSLEAAVQDAPLAPNRSRLDALLDVVDAALEGREVLVGGRFTAADVVLASVLHRASATKLLDGHPHLVEYVLRQTRRPASARAVSS